MNERKPGLVIVAAILNFFSTITFFSLTLFSALAMLFGSAWGIDRYMNEQISQYAPNPNISYGLTLIFGVAFVLFLVLALFFLFIGIGLLSGKKIAWYLQVAMSTLSVLSLPLGLMTGALALPLGSILNIVILVMFLRRPVREYFKV